MSSYYTDHRPYGYTWHADIYCGQCGHDLADIDPEGNEKHPVFSWELNELNTDGPTTCATCHAPTIEWWPA